jgi:hypothetical protein
MKISSYLLILFGVVTLFTACEKDNEDNWPVSKSSELRLVFSSASISLNDIDSATVMLTKAGSTAIRKKLEKKNGYMAVTATDIPAGNWQMEWTIYAESPVGNDEYRRQYAYNSTAAFPFTGALQKPAPKGDFDGTWLPRVWLKDNETGLAIVMGMDFTDPFLSLKAAPGKEYSYYYIDKIALLENGNNSSMVGADNLEVMGNFPAPYVEDRTSFANLAETMKNRNWNKGEILVLIEEKNGPESVFYYNYRK